nr:MAG TPA: hypothetical protein [Caudoviricetes sp.]
MSFFFTIFYQLRLFFSGELAGAVAKNSLCIK